MGAELVVLIAAFLGQLTYKMNLFAHASKVDWCWPGGRNLHVQ